MFPKLSDTEDALREDVRTTKKYDLKYLPAGGLPLFGDNAPESKTLVLKIIERYYPYLFSDYQKQFSRSDYVMQRYQRHLNGATRRLVFTFG
ncbi:MAG: hypothetical protein WCX28_09620 [Bacteriovoracaceae bacterium]|nr:hypothetical protein [Bacteroidota bacterium]